MGIDEDLVIPNKSLSVYEDAVVCWKGEKMSEWKSEFIHAAGRHNFPIHRPYFELSDKESVLTLEVADNGHGMAPRMQDKPQAFGLKGLQERARTVGGWLDVCSKPGHGTSVILSVPLAPPLHHPAPGDAQ